LSHFAANFLKWRLNSIASLPTNTFLKMNDTTIEWSKSEFDACSARFHLISYQII
jgi:hypothetical protein